MSTQDTSAIAAESPPQDGRIAVALTNVSKAFGSVQALDNVSIRARPGTIHAIVGQNGAGKSTLMRILAGIVPPDEGHIHIGGHMTAIRNPHHARVLGIRMIHQELTLVPHQKVWENICLGLEPTWRGVFLNKRKMRSQASEALRRLGSAIAVDDAVADLALAEQQVVEIAKALARDSRVLILDEPTAALEARQVEALFAVLNRVREEGRTALYVSHRLSEIVRLCDHVSVLRDGRVAGDTRVADTDQGELIRMMIGRSVTEMFPARPTRNGEAAAVVELADLRTNVLRGVTLAAKAGEILGIAGLAGSGIHELGRVLAGDARLTHGEIRIDGRPTRLRSPRVALRNGVVYVTSDRRREGLFPILSVRDNVAIGTLDERQRFGIIHRKAENDLLAQSVERLEIQTGSAAQEVRMLSGGNQQKVLLARWLAARPRVIVFDEPTRGIDIGAKVDIYKSMRTLADSGVAVVMISTDLTEIVGMSDRIVTMRGGQVQEHLDGGCAEREVLAAIV